MFRTPTDEDVRKGLEQVVKAATPRGPRLVAPEHPLSMYLLRQVNYSTVALAIDGKIVWTSKPTLPSAKWEVLSSDVNQIHEVLVKTGLLMRLVKALPAACHGVGWGRVW